MPLPFYAHAIVTAEERSRPYPALGSDRPAALLEDAITLGGALLVLYSP